MADPTAPSPWDDYLFDLRGFVVLPRCASREQVSDLNARTDAWSACDDEWIGGVHRRDPPPDPGLRFFYNVVEGGGAFEEMIDNPGWIGHVRRYVDDDGLHLWQNLVLITGPDGRGTPFHSGGHTHHFRSSFDYHDGTFHCGNVTVLLALTDVGPGDGPTVLLPGSHKSNLPNPRVHGSPVRSDITGEAQGSLIDWPGSLDAVADLTVDVHLRAGDAVVFTEGILHAGRPRIKEGERRMLVFKYAPFWTRDRFGYEASEDLVARLTPERRRIVRPIPPCRPQLTQARSSQLASSR
jgi:hypothetical protein